MDLSRFFAFLASEAALGPHQAQVASASVLFVLAMTCFAWQNALKSNSFGVLGQTILAISIEILTRNLWSMAIQILDQPDTFKLVNILLLGNCIGCMMLMVYFVHSLRWNNVLLRSDNAANLSISASSGSGAEEHIFVEATNEEVIEAKNEEVNEVKNDEINETEPKIEVHADLPSNIARSLGDTKARILERKRAHAMMTVQ